MVYNTVEHVVLDQIRTKVLEKPINKPADQYFEAGKVAEDLGKGLLRNDELLSPGSIILPNAGLGHNHRPTQGRRSWIYVYGNRRKERRTCGSRGHLCALSTGSYEYRMLW